MRLLTTYIACLLLLTNCRPLHAQNYSYNSTPVLSPKDDPAKKLADAVIYKIEAPQTPVYTGQPILVQYKLYMSVLDEPSPGKVPAFTGCSIVELPQQNGPILETLNGKTYNVLVVRRLQVTPLQEGPLVLPEASINNIIEYVTTDRPYDVKNFPLAAVCKPVTLTVNALPDTNRPADFSGLVGHFTLKAKVDSNVVPANDNTHLTLVIAGTGNIGAINQPEINWPANTQHFDATDTQRISADTFPVSGEKIFNIPFIGTKQGAVTIPPVSFSYFDPVAQKYVSLTSDSLNIQFTGALQASEEKEIVTGDITNRKYLWIVPAIALVVAFVLVITGKKQRNEKKRKAAEKLQQQKQEAAKPQPVMVPKPVINFEASIQVLKDTIDDGAFFIRTKELLTRALQQKFNISSTNEQGVLAELNMTGIDEDAIKGIAHIYKICNLRLYSPAADEGERALIMEKLAVLIERLKP